MHLRTVALLLLAPLALAAVACGSAEPDSSADVPSGGPPAGVTARDVATGLEIPWGIDFLPDGDALVTERESGRLLRVTPRGGVTEEAVLPSVARGEGGLLGIVVSPGYREDGFVYAYYTTDEDNRVVRFRLGEEPEPVLTGIAASDIHNGGRIAFGPDGMLYVATGDAADPDSAQDPDSLNGKILRITPEGDVPADNPDPSSPVYSLGHRNVQGLTWDADDQLFASEFGEGDLDEVNRIEASGNYGWPEVEGDGGEPEFVDPITTWSPSEASPSGAEIALDSPIGEWEGDMFVAALRGERLWRLELDGGEVTEREALYDGEYGRIRTVVQAPDGSLWVATSNKDGRGDPREGDDRIVRIGG